MQLGRWFIPGLALWHGLLALIVAAVILLPSKFQFQPMPGRRMISMEPVIRPPEVQLSWTGIRILFLNTFLVAALVAGVLRAVYEWVPPATMMPTRTGEGARRFRTRLIVFVTLCVGIGVSFLSALHGGTFIWSLLTSSV